MAADNGCLRGVQVLSVRPARQDDAFAAGLESAGARVHRCPVLAIAPLPEPERDAIASQVARADHLIVVSRPAAELALELFCRHRLRPPSLIAVGASTAQLLRAAGCKVSVPDGDPRSEGVLALPELQQVGGRCIVILRGDSGRDTLHEILAARGAQVHYGDLYRRVEVTTHRHDIRDLLLQGRLDVVAVHSVAILHSLVSQLDGVGLDRLRRLPVLVPSSRVGAAARAQGVETVIEAASALPEDMVAALRGWYTSGHQ